MGFLVLAEDAYLPSLLRIAFWVTLVSVLVDGAWLATYMSSYLQFFYNSGFKRELRPYFQYIWFVTLLQCVLKLLLAYFIRSY